MKRQQQPHHRTQVMVLPVVYLFVFTSIACISLAQASPLTLAYCSSSTCVERGGDCSASGATCLPGLYPLYSGSTCTCSPLSAFPATGTSCSGPDDETTCGPSAIRVCMANVLESVAEQQTNFYCYQRGLIGDQCSTNYDCIGGRTCGADGYCTGLPLGSVCMTPTTGQIIGYCGLGLACNFTISVSTSTTSGSPSITYLGNGRCVPSLKIGDSCVPRSSTTLTTMLQCGTPNSHCDSTTATCQTVQPGTLVAGQAVTVNAGQCQSGISNGTSCLGIGQYNSLYANRACDVYGSESCGYAQDFFGSSACSCTSSTTMNCSAIDTTAMLDTYTALQNAWTDAYAKGCERNIPPTEMVLWSAKDQVKSWCPLRMQVSYTTYIAGQCRISAASPDTSLDCGNSYAKLCASVTTNATVRRTHHDNLFVTLFASLILIISALFM